LTVSATQKTGTLSPQASKKQLAGVVSTVNGYAYALAKNHPTLPALSGQKLPFQCITLISRQKATSRKI
jgi:hypothetical protein